MAMPTTSVFDAQKRKAVIQDKEPRSTSIRFFAVRPVGSPMQLGFRALLNLWMCVAVESGSNVLRGSLSPPQLPPPTELPVPQKQPSSPWPVLLAALACFLRCGPTRVRHVSTVPTRDDEGGSRATCADRRKELHSCPAQGRFMVLC